MSSSSVPTLNATLFREICARASAMMVQRVCTPDGAFSLRCAQGRLVGDTAGDDIFASPFVVPVSSVEPCDLATGGCLGTPTGECTIPLTGIFLISIGVVVLAIGIGVALGALLVDLHGRCAKQRRRRRVHAALDDEPMDLYSEEEGEDRNAMEEQSASTESTSVA